ncbi:MAG: NADH-quinone oxidoreductase subunit N [Planctomycetes bacterium]|nr:NADH-quinone oxidoreductase subunit N [Planctomycetota bacterium]
MNAGSYMTQLAPELAVALGACIALLCGVSRSAAVRAAVAPIAVAALGLSLVATVAGASGHPQATEFGAPGLLFTSLTFYIRLIAAGVGVLILMVNWHVPEESERGEFFAMILLALTGVMLTASANDLVVLFFAIELVAVPTYVLVALSRTDIRAPEAAVKYFFLGALSAALMVYGFSFLYGVAGTTLLHGPEGVASIASYFHAVDSWETYATIGFLLAFAGLAFKMAAVPFHVYAPDVYEGASSPVTGLLGFVPKLAGFVGLIKLLGLTGWVLSDELTWVLWAVAAATMTAGNVLALLQTNVKRTLAYSSIAHTGYMLIGILVGPLAGEGPMHDGVAAVLFYIAVYGIMNLGAFAVLSALTVRGEDVEQLDDLAGLHHRHPGLALALAICCFSLMGFPPTAGFLGKVYIFSSAFSLGADHAFRYPMIVLAVIGVLNSAIGAYYYLRIAGICYMSPAQETVDARQGLPLRWAMGICSLLMLTLFLWPTGLVRRAADATTFLEEPATVAQPELALGHPQLSGISRSESLEELGNPDPLPPVVPRPGIH